MDMSTVHVQAIAMIAAGELPMEDIISHTFPLKEFRKGIDQVRSCNSTFDANAHDNHIPPIIIISHTFLLKEHVFVLVSPAFFFKSFYN